MLAKLRKAGKQPPAPGQPVHVAIKVGDLSIHVGPSPARSGSEDGGWDPGGPDVTLLHLLPFLHFCWSGQIRPREALEVEIGWDEVQRVRQV